MQTMDNNAQSTKDLAFCDLERELATTRRVLERVPAEHFDWKAHETSMSLRDLAGHVATMPIWLLLTVEQDGLDFSSPPNIPRDFSSREGLLKTFDDNADRFRAAMERLDDSALEQDWTLTNGGQSIYTAPRSYVLRVWCVNHMIHHRGQLCTYLRMLDVPVPAVYFNSVDEPEMKFE